MKKDTQLQLYPDGVTVILKLNILNKKEEDGTQVQKLITRRIEKILCPV